MTAIPEQLRAKAAELRERAARTGGPDDERRARDRGISLEILRRRRIGRARTFENRAARIEQEGT